MKIKKLVMLSDIITHSDISYSKEKIINLFEAGNEQELFDIAEKLQTSNFENFVKIIGQVNFSNYCEENCSFCDLREENFSLDRYRIAADEIVNKVISISNLGFKSVILESGRDTFFDTDIIAYIIYSIKQKADITIILSLGERGFDEYKRWRLAGADSYLLKFETSNPKIFSKFNENRSLEVRLRHISYLQKIGFKVGSGSIFGLPGQSAEDIIEDIYFCKDFDFSVFSSFIPLPFTPMQNYPECNNDCLKKYISLARVILAEKDISYLSVIDAGINKYNSHEIKSGSNTIILNFPFILDEHSSLLYPSQKKSIKSPSEIHTEMKQVLESLGKRVAPY